MQHVPQKAEAIFVQLVGNMILQRLSRSENRVAEPDSERKPRVETLGQSITRGRNLRWSHALASITKLVHT